mgnify:FL=1
MLTFVNQAKENGISLLQKTASKEYNSALGRSLQKGALLTVNKILGIAIPFATRNHFEVIELGNGYLKGKIPLKGNKNHIGTMYAGALFTLAELPGGILSIFNFDSNYYPILKELKMTYLKVAKTDVTVEFSLSKREIERIEKESSEKGKSPFTLHGQLKDTEGNVVATSEAHYQVRKHP